MSSGEDLHNCHEQENLGLAVGGVLCRVGYLSEGSCSKRTKGPEKHISGAESLCNSVVVCEAQHNDENLGHILQWLKSDTHPDWQEVSSLKPDIKVLWGQMNLLVIKDGVLYHKMIEDCGCNSYRLIVPKSLQHTVLEQLHSVSSAGHLGIKKTYSRASKCFYWVNMKYDVEEWCKNCETCAVREPPTRKRRAEMKIYKVDAPMERLATDKLNNRSVMMVIATLWL